MAVVGPPWADCNLSLQKPPGVVRESSSIYIQSMFSIKNGPFKEFIDCAYTPNSTNASDFTCGVNGRAR